jgi:hypothetical protein
MFLKSTPSFNLLESLNSEIDTYLNDTTGVYVFCEGNDKQGDKDTVTDVKVAITDCLNSKKNNEIIQLFNRTKDKFILEGLSSSVSEALEKINSKWYNLSRSSSIKSSSISVTILVILDGYLLLLHVGNGSVYQYNQFTQEQLTHPQTKYHDKFDLYKQTLSKDYEDEKNIVTNSIGYNPIISIDRMLIPISNEIIIVALSSASSKFHYETTFWKAIEQKKDQDTDQIMNWLNKNYSTSGKRCDFVVIKSTSTDATQRMERLKDEISIIENQYIFSHLSKDQTALRMIRGLVEFRSFNKGDHLYKKSDTNIELFIFISGIVEVDRGSGPFLQAKRGDMLGEMSIFSGATSYVSNAKAIESGRAMVIKKDKIMNIIKENTRFGYPFLLKILELITKRTILLADEVNMYKRNNP